MVKIETDRYGVHVVDIIDIVAGPYDDTHITIEDAILRLIEVKKELNRQNFNNNNIEITLEEDPHEETGVSISAKVAITDWKYYE